MTIDEVEQKLIEVEDKLRQLIVQRDSLRRDKMFLLSHQWIKANNVALDNVELSSGDDRPYFSHISKFGEWLGQQSTVRKFAEWNGMILSTSDVISGTFDFGSPGRMDELTA